MNYTELTTAITDFLEDEETEFAAHIDDFIRLAEQRIHVALKLPVQRRNVSGAMTASNRFLTIPEDVLEVLSVRINSGASPGYLDKKKVTFLIEAYPDTSSEARPSYYAVFDQNTLLLAPTPDTSYGVEMHYDRAPESIVTATNTWIGDNLERLLLYGALVEGYTFMKGDEDLLAKYEGAFKEELEKAALKVQRGRVKEDELRTG